MAAIYRFLDIYTFMTSVARESWRIRLFVWGCSSVFTFSTDSDLLELVAGLSLCFPNQWFRVSCCAAVQPVCETQTPICAKIIGPPVASSSQQEHAQTSPTSPLTPRMFRVMWYVSWSWLLDVLCIYGAYLRTQKWISVWTDPEVGSYCIIVQHTDKVWGRYTHMLAKDYATNRWFCDNWAHQSRVRPVASELNPRKTLLSAIK